MDFPTVMCECESWTIRKAEHWRIDAFEVFGEDSWESLLRASLSNQSILKEISPEYSLEGLMLKLKLQYFGHLMRRSDSFEKTLIRERLKARGQGDDREWDGWMASLMQWTWVWVSSSHWWWIGKPVVLQSMESQRVKHDSNWTELKVAKGLLRWLSGKESMGIAVDIDSIPESGRSPGEGNGNQGGKKEKKRKEYSNWGQC